jgi:hypothetical protein
MMKMKAAEAAVVVVIVILARKTRHSLTENEP